MLECCETIFQNPSSIFLFGFTKICKTGGFVSKDFNFETHNAAKRHFFCRCNFCPCICIEQMYPTYWVSWYLLNHELRQFRCAKNISLERYRRFCRFYLLFLTLYLHKHLGVLFIFVVVSPFFWKAHQLEVVYVFMSW